MDQITVPVYAHVDDPKGFVKYYAHKDNTILGAALQTQFAINEISDLNKIEGFERYTGRFKILDKAKSPNACVRYAS